MNSTLNTLQLSKDQIEYLTSLHFINRIDGHLKCVSNIKVTSATSARSARVILALEMYYDDNKFDTLTFDLHNYSYDEIIDVARDIRSNEFILQEVDNFLAGDIE